MSQGLLITILVYKFKDRNFCDLKFCGFDDQFLNFKIYQIYHFFIGFDHQSHLNLN